VHAGVLGRGQRRGHPIKQPETLIAGNRGVVYVGQGKVEVRTIPTPELVDRGAVARSTASF